jgi:hypothetical protein
MKRFALALPLFCLAACNNGSDVEMQNASPEEVAEKMQETKGGDSFVNPGKWQQTVALMEIDAPGMPEQVRASMKQAMGQAQVHEVCLTKEQAKNPKEDFFAGKDQNCTYEHFNWGGGKIDLKLNCKHPNASQTMVLTGDYQPDSYTMTMIANTEGGGPMEKMTMTMKVDAKRVGECDGKEQLKAGS